MLMHNQCERMISHHGIYIAAVRRYSTGVQKCTSESLATVQVHRSVQEKNWQQQICQQQSTLL